MDEENLLNDDDGWMKKILNDGWMDEENLF